jgi:hypothetical protein
MNAMGWQIGAIFIGLGILGVSIYLCILIKSATNMLNKAYKIVDYNERHIHETIENLAGITKNTDKFIDILSSITNIGKLLKIISRK